ncbi:curli-like amyloid fiber formation chaperone CsgH [Oricola thermophila]|uniref:CsgH-like domain-containing protein n=1 Tax=Oricola thermophila TaxID=2742145 RepID=A0A6N1VC86_9HYPH|nr:curli-like amyloid fiber formation chaperone CsgH [Oricola thermophila]QKV18464.1 hypothetical protein HTY61_08365 [Oricola thermophila]
MSRIMKTKPVAAAAVLAAAALAGCNAGAGEKVPDRELVQCEIDVSSSGRSLELGAVVHARKPVTGTYSLAVSGSGSSGSTSISQGGFFSAGPGDDARLGKLVLANNGAQYRVRLDIDVAGRDHSCVRTVGGI